MISMNENIVKIEYNEKEIYLVKTAHVSKNSVQDVDDCVKSGDDILVYVKDGIVEATVNGTTSQVWDE